MISTNSFKNVVKVLLTIIAIWLVSIIIDTTFSSEVYLLNYEGYEHYATVETDEAAETDETDETTETTETDESNETDETTEPNETTESDETTEPDESYYWTSDMDENSDDSDAFVPFNWGANQNQAGTLNITGNVNTNGFSRTGNITVASGSTLTISGDTTITGWVVVQPNATLIMNSGTINYTDMRNPGTITDVFDFGYFASVIVTQGATFTMNGGRVTGTGSRGIRLHGGTFNLFNGEVAGNFIPPHINMATDLVGNTNGRGGGVMITASNSTMNMTGGWIHNNTAGQGGAIAYVGGVGSAGLPNHNHRIVNVSVNLSGGSIVYNSALSPTRGGGGGAISIISGSIFGRTSDPSVVDLNLSGNIDISRNSSVDSGGGIEWNTMGTFTMTGGHIHRNQASSLPHQPHPVAPGQGRFGGGGISITPYMGQSQTRPIGNVYIRGGIIELNTAHGHGGALWSASHANVYVGGNVIMRNNEAGFSGGGISSTGAGNLTIYNNALIHNNGAHHFGGGINRGGTGNLTINNSARILYNLTGYDGGGVRWNSTGTFNMLNGTISGNLSQSRTERYSVIANHNFGGGGGIDISGGTVNISGGIIGETTALPGATENPPSNLTTPANTMTFDSNRALNGAGLRIAGGNVTMTGGYIQRNVTNTTAGVNTAAANGLGGGVFLYSGTFNYNTTTGHIRNNLANRGGGAYVMGPLISGNAPFVITNGSIRDNEAMLNGGGIYVAAPSRADMNGGNIQGNLARGTGPVGPELVFGQPIQGITPGAAHYNGHGGGIYVQRNAAFRATTGRITDNNAQTGDGGGIHTEFRLYECNILPAGATGNYSNITIGAGIIFANNNAHRHTLRTPCNPTALTTINASVPVSTSPFPGGAWPSFPNGNHPLNNFDVNYLVTYDVPQPLDPEITKVAINPSTGAPLTADERILQSGSTVTYRITVTNPNQFILEDHLVIDNLANGRLTNIQINPIGIVPSSALVTRPGASPAVVENEATSFDELHVILDLPAATATADGVVTITFTASLAPSVSGAITNWVYLFGEADDNGDRGQIIVPDVNHEDGYYREGYIDNDDETVTVRVPNLIPEIVKSANYTEPVHVGDDVEYSIIVENPNDVDLVGVFEVIDGLVEYVELVDQTSVVVTRTVDGNPVPLVRGTHYTVSFDAEAGVLRVTLNGMPASSVTEIAFTVEVVELPAGGYVPNIAVLRLPDGDLNYFPPGTGSEIPSNEVEVPVVEPEGVELRFVKTNEYLYIDMEADEFERLDGAIFELSRYVDGEWEYIETATSQNLGLVVFENLLSLDGTYRLDETRPPDGFRLPQGYWIITWNAETGSFDIEARGTLSLVPAFREVDRDEGVDLYLGNFRETLLPASGGLGAMAITSIGILTMSFVTLLYVRGRMVETEQLKSETSTSTP